MNRGTDSALIADSQPHSGNEAIVPVRVSVEKVGQLVVPRDGTGPALYLPDLDALATIAEGIKPTLNAFAKVGQQIAGSSLRTLCMRLAQWGKIRNIIFTRRSKASFIKPSQLDKFLRRISISEFLKALSNATLIQIIGSFVQQVFNSNSIMHTGPPLPSTGLPIKCLVTTWGREA